MNRNIFGSLGVVSAIMCFASAPQTQAALLEGRLVFARLEHRDSLSTPLTADDAGAFIVGPGVEVVNLGTEYAEVAENSVILNIDYSDTQIVITAVNNQPFALTELLQIQVIGSEPPRLTGTSLNPATDWAGFTASRLFDPPIGGVQPQFNVQLSQLTALQGQQIVIDLVPEPASAALASGLALGLVALRRRRSAFVG